MDQALSPGVVEDVSEDLDDAVEAVAQSLDSLPDETSADETAEVPVPVVSDDAQEASEPAEEPTAEPVEDQAPEPVDVVEAAEPTEDILEEIPAKPRSRVSWWPYILYAVLWVGLLTASYLLLTGAQTQVPAFRQDAYPYLVLAGLVLTLLGPVLSLAVWLLGWFKAGKGERGGLLTTALVRGAVLTFMGVALWWGMLVLVDALRLGLV